ncbi:MAG: ATP-binding cassette domain-containing protein [Clostridia bacterium]|jgi:ABC-type sugar transport system ATPase subunit|nr:ATP-binding cassette domain-containing protein [Clostridia bacterium]
MVTNKLLKEGGDIISKSEPILELRGMCKYFGGVHALEDVDFELYPNEVLALVGDNAAGKSTLIKIIAGVYQPTKGEIYIEGKEIEIHSPRAAMDLGIATVYQDLALVDKLDVVENIFLGRPLTKFRWFINRKAMVAETIDILKRLKIFIYSLTVPVQNLSGGQRQALAVGRAIAFSSKIVILDEPTAALGVEESWKVLALMKQIKERGGSIIVVSHNLRHIFDVSDRIIVLRGGRRVGTRIKSETNIDEIVKLITGSLQF